MKRTHHCNELRLENAGQEATLSGWVHSCRDLGGVIFIDVRDREGRTQAVFDPQETDPALVESASKLHSETVISVSGKVRQRPADTANPKIPTDDVEIVAAAMEVGRRPNFEGRDGSCPITHVGRALFHHQVNQKRRW